MPKYSKTTGWLYGDGLPSPADSVEITKSERDAFMAAQRSGLKIVPDINGRPVAKDLRTLQDFVRQAIAQVNQEYDRAGKLFINAFPEIERLGWDEQIRAVEKFEADPSAENMLLDALALANARTRAEQAASIKANRTRFLSVYAALTSMRQMLQRQIEQAATLPEPQALGAISAVDTSAFMRIIGPANP